MKKRMMLFAAGAVIFAGMTQNVFAEEETGGIKKIVEMITEAQEITQGTVMVSLSMALGDAEVSAGTTINMMPGSASVDMLYLSAPNNDGTFFDLISEDVLRIIDTKAYLSIGFIDDFVSALEEEEGLNREDNEVVFQIVDSFSGDWIGLNGVKMREKQPYNGWTQLLSGFAAAHDAGSYTITLENEQIREVLERLDDQVEAGTEDLSIPFDMDELLMPYLNAIIEGKSMDGENLLNEVNAILDEYTADERKPFAEQFDEAVSKGLVVDASICVGKDGAAGTYAFETTIEVGIPEEIQEELGFENLSRILGGSEIFEEESDEDRVRNAMVNFVVSIEPAEEPSEIEEPEENVLWLTDLLREWAAQGVF